MVWVSVGLCGSVNSVTVPRSSRPIDHVLPMTFTSTESLQNTPRVGMTTLVIQFTQTHARYTRVKERLYDIVLRC